MLLLTFMVSGSTPHRVKCVGMALSMLGLFGQGMCSDPPALCDQDEKKDIRTAKEPATEAVKHVGKHDGDDESTVAHSVGGSRASSKTQSVSETLQENVDSEVAEK